MYFSRLHASLIVQTELLIFFSSISHCSPNLYCYEIYNQHHTNMWCFYVQANVHMGIEHKLMICIHAMFRHQNWKVLNAFLELIPMNISLMYWIKFKKKIQVEKYCNYNHFMQHWRTFSEIEILQVKMYLFPLERSLACSDYIFCCYISVLFLNAH